MFTLAPTKLSKQGVYARYLSMARKEQSEPVRVITLKCSSWVRSTTTLFAFYHLARLVEQENELDRIADSIAAWPSLACECTEGAPTEGKGPQLLKAHREMHH